MYYVRFEALELVNVTFQVTGHAWAKTMFYCALQKEETERPKAKKDKEDFKKESSL